LIPLHVPLFSLCYITSQGYFYGSQYADRAYSVSACPDECDCPSSFPVAMYCNGRGLTTVPPIPSHIKYLYLQHNAITSLPDSALSNATNLVWLMLHFNQLTSESIGKKVNTIPSNLPLCLRDLRMDNNMIEKVSPADLEGMDNLTILYLHDNALSEVGSSLKGLNSLTLLDLSSNKLTKVPAPLPAYLHQLYLEYNAIDSIPEGFLSLFSQLQYFRMSHNLLTNKGIPANTFNVSGLVELDLSFNKLERIPSVSTTLQYLYLQANQIKEFTVGSFCSVVDVTNFSRLLMVRLDGNELSLVDIPTDVSHCLRQVLDIEI
uniref:Fibromodulin n=1 Tax=Pundamilia nyererei TaxID=303518 RepID=A0A3B4GNM2_9CICH